MSDIALQPPVLNQTAAPDPGQFPEHSAGWYLFCHERELSGGPLARDFLGRRLVAFRATGGIAILDARCSHLGADLGLGSVHNGCLRCPFHHWEYAADGRCLRIPAQAEIPLSARQRAYPVQAMGPYIFLFNGHRPLYPLPFFPGKTPQDFVAAKPFSTILECPWYLVGCNGFDRQHFNAAHDRILESAPRTESPSPFSRRATATFKVAGDTWRDGATRLLSGHHVTMADTDWSGSLIFVTAKFRRSTSYGMVSIRALGPRRTFAQVVIWAPRSRHWLLRQTADRLNLHLRRYFIRKFLETDAAVLNGCDYRPGHLIAADAAMIEYLNWLAFTSNGLPVGEGPPT